MKEDGDLMMYFLLFYFRVTFPDERISIGSKRRLSDSDSDDAKPVMTVEPFTIENRGPYPYNQPKK